VAIFNEDTFLFWDETVVTENKIRDIQMMIVLIVIMFFNTMDVKRGTHFNNKVRKIGMIRKVFLVPFPPLNVTVVMPYIPWWGV
jgi:hypothetical protein